MHFFYDENKVRYRLVRTGGGKNLNWLFFPGGAGGDSRYFESLTDLLHLDGNIWFLDFPGSGTHKVPGTDYETWFDIFIPTIKRFENPVIVGHSFGAMMPLLFEELEDLLKGFVAIASSPCLWLEASANAVKQFNLPDISKEMGALLENPSQENFDTAIAACAPYYFRPDFLEQGREILKKIPFDFEAASWSLKKLNAINFNASWIPQNVETMLIGGHYDAMVPFSLFAEDKRFDRTNIQKALFEDAGHVPWLENPEGVKKLFENFQEKL